MNYTYSSVKSPPARHVKNAKTGQEQERRDVLSVETYTPISSFEHGKTYEQIFLVAEIVYNDKMKTAQGSAFARVTLKDVTGSISGVVWGYDETLEEGSYAILKIETKLYRGELEFSAQAENTTPTETPINIFDYVVGVGENSLTAYAHEIEDEIMSIDDATYRDIMGNAIHRLDFMNALKTSPYGITGPMAYRGGLLVHVAHSMRLAKVAIGQSKELEIPFSPSLVVVGCALRNIGWYTTTRFQGDYLRPRDAYHMIGIHRASARYIDHLMLTCESDLQIAIPESKKQALENMCNRQSEIRTLEGKIVSCADNMADVLDFSVATLQRKQHGSWTDELFVGHLS